MCETFPDDPPPAPRLLVSVRSADEARAGLAGGSDVLDVKEPSRGSLGMAPPGTIAAVLQAAGSGGPRRGVPVSAALGETLDWLRTGPSPGMPAEPAPPASPALPPWPALPAGLAFVKLGLAGLRGREWFAGWCAVRRRFDAAAGTALKWIAVAYADWPSADAPPPEAVIEAAIETRCAGVLFDTHSKQADSLVDLVEPPRLARLIDAIQRRGLLAAVAGGLSSDHLSALAGCRPDVIAIRGAACHAGQRTGTVTAAAVRSFRAAVGRAFQPDSGQAAPPRRESGWKA